MGNFGCCSKSGTIFDFDRGGSSRGNTSFGGGAGGGLITGGGSFGAPADKKEYCMTDLLSAMRKVESYPEYPGAGATGMPDKEDEALAMNEGNQRVARNSTHRLYLDSGDWLGLGVVGDNGRALGPFQIWEVYYKDARQKWRPSCMKDLRQVGDLCRGKNWDSDDTATYSTLGEVSEDALNLSICVVLSYLRRYASEAFARLCKCKGTLADVKKAARIHNGGPKGYRKDSTLDYWNKVLKNL